MPLLQLLSQAAWAIVYKNDMSYKNDRLILGKQGPDVLKILLLTLMRLLI